MPHSISCSFSASITDGPSQSVARLITVDIYDVINVRVPAAAGAVPGTVTVPVQPSPVGGKVRFLMLTSSIYDAGLTCEVDGGSTLLLDSPQLITGTSIDVLLGAVPETCIFENPLLQPALITIIVGRNA